jgi:hypothetical protein
MDMYYYLKMKEYYEKQNDELIDSLYHYFKALIEEYPFDIVLFKDEIHNLIGLKEHDEIIEFIMANY